MHEDGWQRVSGLQKKRRPKAQMTFAGKKRKELVGRPQSHAVYLAYHNHFWCVLVVRGEVLGSGRQLVLVIPDKSEKWLMY